MKALLLAIILALFACGLPACVAIADTISAGSNPLFPRPADTHVRVIGDKIIAPFNDLPPALTKDPLLDLKASVEASRVQSKPGNHISLLITINNSGKQQVDFANPLDFLTVAINDQNGKPIQLPPDYSRFLLDGPEVAGDPNKFYLPFAIQKVILNTRRLTVTELEQHSFSLLPGKRLQIGINITRIVVSSKLVPFYNAQARSTSSEPLNTYGDLPAGKYLLTLMLSLVVASNNQASRMLQTGTLNIEVK